MASRLGLRTSWRFRGIYLLGWLGWTGRLVGCWSAAGRLLVEWWRVSNRSSTRSGNALARAIEGGAVAVGEAALPRHLCSVVGHGHGLMGKAGLWSANVELCTEYRVRTTEPRDLTRAPLTSLAPFRTYIICNTRGEKEKKARGGVRARHQVARVRSEDNVDINQPSLVQYRSRHAFCFFISCFICTNSQPADHLTASWASKNAMPGRAHPPGQPW